jgi:hypothetical protein
MTAAATSIIRLPLTLAPAHGTGRAAKTASVSAAWLIPGGDASLWMAELASWNVPLDDVRLLVLPASANDVRPSGVLAVTGPDARPAVSSLAQPYVAVNDRLYMPTGTSPRPPMSRAELEQWLVWDVQAMHPTIGLIGCRREDLMRVSDLLVASPPDAVDWSRADPGLVVEPRVRSVKPSELPAIDDFLQESRDSIGRDAPESLPPLPQESPIGRAGAAATAGAMGAIAGIAGVFAAAAGAVGGAEAMRRLQQWAAARRDALRAGLAEARQRELARLMRLLESQPDEGLKFALPLRDIDSSRGVAPPGGSLARRNVDFSFGSLFRSGAADAWDIGFDFRQRLQAKYRELASRELALGRFRRAAYVFAELLGDFAGAANALRQGRFFREAAVLYRDRLRQPLVAAECLEAGGLLEEAIEIFLTLKLYERVGDLHRRLGYETAAEEAYRAAVAELRARRDTLAAARLLDGKLGRVDEALELLLAEWPYGAQAGLCLGETFVLLGREARHDEAARRVDALARDASRDSHARALADVLADGARGYPSVPIRDAASDATRVVAGRRLAAGEPAPLPTEARQLVDAVARATSDDRLLARDTNRFVEAVNAAQAKRASAPAARRPVATRPNQPSGGSITRVRTFSLGAAGAVWRTAIARPSTIYAQAVADVELLIARATWDGGVQHVRQPFRGDPELPWRLEPVDGALLTIPLLEAPHPRPPREFAADASFHERIAVLMPDWLPDEFILDACTDEDGGLWVVHAGHEDFDLSLSGYAGVGGGRSLLWTRDLGVTVAPERAAGVTVGARAGLVCVTHGRQMTVLATQDRRLMSTIDLPADTVRLTASPVHTRPRMTLAFAEGAAVCWPAEARLQPFAAELIDPAVCITREGLLVAAGRKHCRTYRIAPGGAQLQMQASVETRESAPIAVTTAPGEGAFAIYYADGLVDVMKSA